jgi:hypothetical protein
MFWALNRRSRPLNHRHHLAVDIDLHFHPQLVLRTSGISTGERNCLARITRDRDADEIAVSDDAICGIEFDPAASAKMFHSDSVMGLLMLAQICG